MTKKVGLRNLLVGKLGSILCLSMTFTLTAFGECEIVGEYDNGEPVVECFEDHRITADICDPRVVEDCYGDRNPNPRPYANPRTKLPYRGGEPGPAAGKPPFGASGSAPFGAAGGTVRNPTGRR